MPVDWSPQVHRAIRAGQAPAASLIEQIVRPSAPLLGDLGVAREQDGLRDAHLGLGPLAPVVAASEVTDVLVNGDGRVWVDRGNGVEPASTRIPVGQLRGLAVRLAGLAGRRLDDAQPWVDGQLPGGIRLHAVLPPLVEGSAHLSLRVPRHFPDGIDALVSLGMVSAAGADLLAAVVESRASFIIIGGTGSGKTTLLAGLLAQCPHRERIVVAEDVSELGPSHPHVVRLQGRGPNVEGVGEVTLVDLVRQALRMRPDRLVVGEVRGAEVRELLLALNTGHSGGAGTLHANGSVETLGRLEALAALAGMTRAALHAQLRHAIQLVLVVAREGSARRLVEIAVVDSAGPEITIVPAVRFVGESLEQLAGWSLLSARIRAGERS